MTSEERYCECGCGRAVSRRARFITGHNMRIGDHSGPNNPTWKGGRSECSVDGCSILSWARGLCPTHYKRWHVHGSPHVVKIQVSQGWIGHGYKLFSEQNKRVREHRFIAETVIGRPLPAGAVIHHANGDKLDNRPANLVVCPDRAYHNLLHRREIALDISGHADWRRCCRCGKFDAPVNMHIGPSQAYHQACNTAHQINYMKRKKHA